MLVAYVECDLFFFLRIITKYNTDVHSGLREMCFINVPTYQVSHASACAVIEAISCNTASCMVKKIVLLKN